MNGDTNDFYYDPDARSTYAGDPFTGTPIPQSVIEAVANDHEVAATTLARALQDFATTPTLAPLETLFTGFDPTPVGVDDAGHLFVRADAAPYWEVVAAELGLTTAGRDALKAAHDRHVTATTSTQLEDGLGIAVSCPEFPAAAIEDIRLIGERTSLSNRQATIWALTHQARSPAAVATLLGIPEALVRTELVAVDRAGECATTAAETFAGRHSSVTANLLDPTARNWLGLDWSSWYSLHDRSHLLDILPRAPGVYRVRHTRVRGLLYIGEAGSEGGVRDRVGLELAGNFATGTPSNDGSHNATQSLQQIATRLDGTLEVSVATPPIAANYRHRRALEAALIAVCRREVGWTPSVQLNRTPLADVPTHSTQPETLEAHSEARSYPTLDWTGWRATANSNWMGLPWTSPRALADRATIELSETCAFRVWTPQEDTPHWYRVLTYIGTTETPVSRLFSLESTYGSDSLFAVAPLTDVSSESSTRSRERSEVRYDLIGAHYLAVGKPPIDQF